VELSAQVCCPSLLLNACQQCIDINRANNNPWVSNRLLIQSQQSACNLHICQLSSTKPVKRLAFRITFKRLPNPWINMQIQLSFWFAGFAFGMQMSTVFYQASLFFYGASPMRLMPHNDDTAAKEYRWIWLSCHTYFTIISLQKVVCFFLSLFLRWSENIITTNRVLCNEIEIACIVFYFWLFKKHLACQSVSLKPIRVWA